MIRAGIIGATGYTGVELVRLLSGHPEVSLSSLASHSYAGETFSGVYPAQTDLCDMELSVQDPEKVAEVSDVLFLALPHGHATEAARAGLARGIPVIDLGADFRFRDKRVYETWYKVAHPGEDLFPKARYCLPEINRQEIPGTAIVGNPGCYPTSVILGLAPLLRRGWLDPASVIVDAKSGVSGAGRSLALGSHFTEVNDSIRAYGITDHRHTPEIEEQLSRVGGTPVMINFTPHLVPMTRGILSTMYARLSEDLTDEVLREAYMEDYGNEYFVHLLPENIFPRTKWVYGSNHVHINLKADRRTGRVVVVSAIDNLVKGASGQAIQNMNILMGLPETTGLTAAPVFP